MFELACGDVMTGCAVRFEHPDRSAMLAQIAAHAVGDHGVHTITPLLLDAVERTISFAS
jgi:predicted small metal-binding protein